MKSAVKVPGIFGQPSPDFFQTWGRTGILEFAPETLGELDVRLASARDMRGRGDQQREMLVLREVQCLERLEHAVLIDGFYVHGHTFIVSPERNCGAVELRPSHLRRRKTAAAL
jgi:hypothetical protein